MNINKRLLNLEKEMTDVKKEENLFVDPMFFRNCHKIYGDGSPYVPPTNVSKEDFDKMVMDTVDKVYSKPPINRVNEISEDSKPN